MAKRTQMYQKIPWTGGINDSVDPGVLDDNDLVLAENVVFATSGSRLKREGLEYLDTDIPAPDTREISSNVATLTFTTNSITETGGSPNELIVDGEYITVSGVSNSVYNVTNVKATVVEVSPTETTVSYAVSGSNETQTAVGNITIKRAESVLCLTDYWRTDGSNVQQQRLVSHTNRGNMFYYDGSNRRVRILGQPEVSTVVCGNVASVSQGDFFTIYSANDAVQYNLWIDIDNAGTGAPSVGGTNVSVEVSTGGTAADVATAVKTALDAISGTPFVTTRDTATLTITNSLAGATTDIADGSAATNFTFSTTLQGATAPTVAIDTIRSIVFNNKVIHCYSGVGNLPTKYRPEDSAFYQKLLNAPDAEYMVSYLSRLWCNDKTDPHRLHYSTTANEEEWNGTGDSGALDIEPGDGDPVGITNIYTYKGALFVAKKTKIYRVFGDSPENFQIVPVTKGLGSEGPMAVNVDQDDVVFVSKRGLHSAQATDQFGDVSSKFLSAKIQNSFNDWNTARLKYLRGAWLPELNSLVFGVPASGSANNDVWLFNAPLQAWYKWPNISCQEVSTRLVGNVTKPLFGTNDGRVITGQSGDFSDFGGVAYTYKIKSGRIYPGGNPQTMKAFKRIGFLYRPKGNFQFTARVKIDNASTQALTFEQQSSGDQLGVNFILGQSVLGFSDVLAPYMQTIDGYGRGITIEIQQASADQQVEIYGFIIEYEEEGYRQEVQGE